MPNSLDLCLCNGDMALAAVLHQAVVLAPLSATFNGNSQLFWFYFCLANNRPTNHWLPSPQPLHEGAIKICEPTAPSTARPLWCYPWNGYCRYLLTIYGSTTTQGSVDGLNTHPTTRPRHSPRTVNTIKRLQHCPSEPTKEKVNRTVSITSSDCSPDNVFSNVTISHPYTIFVLKVVDSYLFWQRSTCRMMKGNDGSTNSITPSDLNASFWPTILRLCIWRGVLFWETKLHYTKSISVLSNSFLTRTSLFDTGQAWAQWSRTSYYPPWGNPLICSSPKAVNGEPLTHEPRDFMLCSAALVTYALVFGLGI